MLSWWLFRRENVKGESVTDNVLWRLYYRKHWSNGDRETRFLHLVIIFYLGLVLAEVCKEAEEIRARKIAGRIPAHMIKGQNTFFGFAAHLNVRVNEV